MDGTIHDPYALGDVSGKGSVEGLIGQSSGVVESCYALGSVSSVSSGVGGLVGSNAGSVCYSYTQGNVSGYDYTGGFVGYNEGIVFNSYAMENVTRIQASIFTYFGGFIGYAGQGSIINCYSTEGIEYENGSDPTDKGFAGEWVRSCEMIGNFWDIDTSGQISTAGNATGKSTTEMMEITTFSSAGWDIALVQDHDQEIWYIDDGNDYPRLWWEEYIERVTFDISLFAGGQSDGWNFVSFNLELEDTSLMAVLADIDGSYDRVMYYDASTDQWLSYVPDRADHFNNLDTWNHRMGIWIRMTEDATLTVEGYVPSSTDITLYPGWNMVGLPSSTEIRASDTLPDEISKIGVFSASAGYNVAYLSKDMFDMILLQPGRGYWMYNSADEAVTWTVDY